MLALGFCKFFKFKFVKHRGKTRRLLKMFILYACKLALKRQINIITMFETLKAIGKKSKNIQDKHKLFLHTAIVSIRFVHNSKFNLKCRFRLFYKSIGIQLDKKTNTWDKIN